MHSVYTFTSYLFISYAVSCSECSFDFLRTFLRNYSSAYFAGTYRKQNVSSFFESKKLTERLIKYVQVALGQIQWFLGYCCTQV